MPHREASHPEVRITFPLVLASLAQGDKHGYAMMVDIEQFAGVRLGPGTLYGAITRLEKHGWIKPVASKDRRRPYRITGAGRAHLKERLGALGRIVKTERTRLDQACTILPRMLDSTGEIVQ